MNTKKLIESKKTSEEIVASFLSEAKPMEFRGQPEIGQEFFKFFIIAQTVPGLGEPYPSPDYDSAVQKFKELGLNVKRNQIGNSGMNDYEVQLFSSDSEARQFMSNLKRAGWEGGWEKYEVVEGESNGQEIYDANGDYIRGYSAKELRNDWTSGVSNYY